MYDPVLKAAVIVRCYGREALPNARSPEANEDEMYLHAIKGCFEKKGLNIEIAQARYLIWVMYSSPSG
jgi:hypothetical protein